MIKKIQQYMLVHYPLIWNIRLVPMLLILIGIHLLIFGISYFSSEITFKDTYYYSYSLINSNGSMYVATIFVGVLLLIGWLLFYMRNNAIKTLYPRTNLNLFSEWILVFVVCVMICSLPISLSTGTITRWQMVASQKETQRVADLLQKARVLIPTDISDYQFRPGNFKPLPISDTVKINPHEVDLDLYAFDYTLEGKIAITGYKGASLLFYYDYDRDYYEGSRNSEHYDAETKRKIENIDTVQRWLRTGQRDSVYTIMTEFCELAKKHDLSFNLTPEQWMKQVYNPPYFKVDYSNPISDTAYDDYYSTKNYSGNTNNYDRGYDDDRELYYVNSYYGDTLVAGTEVEVDNYCNSIVNYSLPYRELKSGYEQITRSYESNEDLNYIVLFSLCVALVLSVFIFSCRVTSGRSWLIAFVIAGVLLFASILFMVIIGASSYIGERSLFMLFFAFWITLFIAILVYLISKNTGKKDKGHSRPLVNIMLWLLPCMSPMFYGVCYSFCREVSGSYDYSFWDDLMLYTFWLNIPIVIVSMFGLTILLRKWKSLPEE